MLAPLTMMSGTMLKTRCRSKKPRAQLLQRNTVKTMVNPPLPVSNLSLVITHVSVFVLSVWLGTPRSMTERKWDFETQSSCNDAQARKTRETQPHCVVAMLRVTTTPTSTMAAHIRPQRLTRDFQPTMRQMPIYRDTMSSTMNKSTMKWTLTQAMLPTSRARPKLTKITLMRRTRARRQPSEQKMTLGPLSATLLCRQMWFRSRSMKMSSKRLIGETSPKPTQPTKPQAHNLLPENVLGETTMSWTQMLNKV